MGLRLRTTTVRTRRRVCVAMFRHGLAICLGWDWRFAVPQCRGRMAAYVIASVWFRDQFGTEDMRGIFSDETTVRRWLDVEAGLAKVQCEMGIIPLDAAAEIQQKCKVNNIDLPDLKAEMDRTAHPIVPLPRAMKEVCNSEAGEYIHWRATTQDIMHTGNILQIKEGWEIGSESWRERVCQYV